MSDLGYDNSGKMQFSTFNLKLENNGSLYFGDLREKSSDALLADQVSFGVSGALKDGHLIDDFFSIALKGNVSFDATGPRNILFDASLPFFFYLGDPRDSWVGNIVRFGLEPLAVRTGMSTLLSWWNDMRKEDEFSYLSYDPALSFLWFNKDSGLGLFLRLSSEAYGKIRGKNDGDIFAEGTTYSFDAYGELLWMPFWEGERRISDGYIDDVDVETFLRGITLFIAGEGSARWLEWNKNNDGRDFNDFMNFGRFLFGIRYNLFTDEGNGMFSKM